MDTPDSEEAFQAFVVDLGADRDHYTLPELRQLYADVLQMADLLIEAHGIRQRKAEAPDPIQLPAPEPAAAPTPADPRFPLKGQMLCPTCNKPMTASVSKGRSKSYAYYHCWRGCKTRVPAAASL